MIFRILAKNVRFLPEFCVFIRNCRTEKAAAVLIGAGVVKNYILANFLT